jgi:hypothetical protein
MVKSLRKVTWALQEMTLYIQGLRDMDRSCAAGKYA